jgi:putative ABC transport system permease protein
VIGQVVARARSLWRAVRRGSAVDAEADEEFRAHIEMRAEDLVRSGLSPEEARRRARIEFGSVERYKEEGRAARGLRAFDELRFSWLDVRLGARMLIKYPGLTIVGVFALAFAIFVGATGFEITKRAVFPHVSVADPRRVVTIGRQGPGQSSPGGASVRDFELWREQVKSVESLGAFRVDVRNLSWREGWSEALMLVEMTPSAFPLTGGKPLLGRTLVEADERADVADVIVLGYDIWQSMGADQEIIGRTVRVGAGTRTVVGVMPEDFVFPEHWFEAWVPLRPAAQGPSTGGSSALRVIGRLAAGVTIDEAQAELSVLAQRSLVPSADGRPAPTLQVRRFRSFVWSSEGQSPSILSINLLLVMLLFLVCSNIALLVFARAATREGEIAMRTALGAGWRRIVMQLVAESLILAAVSAAIGLLAAELVLRWNFGFPKFGFADRSGLTAETVLYACALAAVAATILGVIPGLKVTRGLAGRLRQVGAGGGGFRFGGLWTVVVIGQIAFTMAFPWSLIEARQTVEAADALVRDAGIPVHQYLMFQLQMDNDGETGLRDIPGDSIRAAAYLARFEAEYQELERRLEAEPRVESVTFADVLPTRAPWVRRIALDQGDGTATDTPAADFIVRSAAVGLDFFEAMDAPILAGRGFTTADLKTGAAVVVVNESFVERILGGKNAVGRRLRSLGEGWDAVERRTPDQPGPWYEIIGVVPDRALATAEVAEGVYNLVAPGAIYPPMVAVRVTGEPTSMVPRIKAVAASVSPSLRVDDPDRIPGLTVIPLDEGNYWNQYGTRMIFSIFAVVTSIAVALSLAGIYAITSFTAWQRTREVGLRVALGADPFRILAVIFRRPLTRVGIGILVGGVLLGVLASKGFSSISAKGAAVFLGYALLMTLVCLLASIVPIRRTLRVDPAEALRADS